MANGSRLVEAEGHFNVNLHGNGIAIFHGGLELPISYCVDCLFIETESERPFNSNVTRRARTVDN